MKTNDEYLNLATFIMERQQRPRPLLVTPVFKFGNGAPAWTDLWQDDRGKRYTYAELPPEAVFRAIRLDDSSAS